MAKEIIDVTMLDVWVELSSGARFSTTMEACGTVKMNGQYPTFVLRMRRMIPKLRMVSGR